MFDGTLASWLQALTQEYLVTKGSDVRVGIHGGHLALDNVELRVETINKHLRDAKIPFLVIKASVGRFRVHVPWSALTSSPVEVYMENVHLLATVNTGDEAASIAAASNMMANPNLNTADGRGNSGKRPTSNSQTLASGDSYIQRFSDAVLNPDSAETSGMKKKDAGIDSSAIPPAKLRRSASAARLSKSSYGSASSPNIAGSLAAKNSRDQAKKKAGSRPSGSAAKIQRQTNALQAASSNTDEEASLAEQAFMQDLAKNGEARLGLLGWHRSLLGRLLFNIQLEINNLKVEYSDSQCRGWISMASLIAHSANEHWERAFVQLDADAQEAFAMMMRKLIECRGLTIVLIPREPKEDGSQSSSESPLAGLLPTNLMSSFEAEYPVINGLGLTIKAELNASGDSGENEAMACKISVDVEDPDLALSARQLQWISHIASISSQQSEVLLPKSCCCGGTVCKQKSSLVTNGGDRKRISNDRVAARTGQRKNTHTKSTQSSVQKPSKKSTKLPSSSEASSDNEASDTNSDESDSSSSSDDSSGSRELEILRVNSERIDLPYATSKREMNEDESMLGALEQVQEQRQKRVQAAKNNVQQIQVRTSGWGRLGQLWSFITKEHGSELTNDAADLLGFERAALGGDQAKADKSVMQAAQSGGITLILRIRTPDLASRAEVERLRIMLEQEREKRLAYEASDAEQNFRQAQKKIEDLEAEAARLKLKNTDLVNELADLERLVSTASANKDSIIRQMEAALLNAERNLMNLLQKVSANSVPRHNRVGSLSIAPSTGLSRSSSALNASNPVSFVSSSTIASNGGPSVSTGNSAPVPRENVLASGGSGILPNQSSSMIQQQAQGVRKDPKQEFLRREYSLPDVHGSKDDLSVV